MSTQIDGHNNSFDLKWIIFFLFFSRKLFVYSTWNRVSVSCCLISSPRDPFQWCVTCFISYFKLYVTLYSTRNPEIITFLYLVNILLRTVFEMIFPLRTRCIFGSLDCCQASAECCVIHACNWELSVKGANPDAMRRLATTKSTEYFKTMTHRFEIFRRLCCG